jgi:methylenetetrahydrofolate dehydrogenase (NADP+)/methenyltetrahydrofolate cyclohydrolase
MTIILDGKKLAEEILDELRKKIKKLSPIRLAVVLVGDNPASLNFIKQKQKAAIKIGVDFGLYKFKKNIKEDSLIKELNKVIKNRTNNGIVIQLPLPKHLDVQKILNIIPQEKDVDALSVDNYLVEPPAASGIIKIIREYKIKIKNKRVVIVGKGRLVGGPLALMMEKNGGKTIVCDKNTKNLASQTIKADILISAAGKPHLIKENMVKKGAVVIDAGFSKVNNKLTGDVDFERVKKKTSYITPVPGGVGPLTVAMLFSNLIKLAKLQINH